MDKDLNHICKVCNKSFKSERALHIHIKSHNILLSEYYTTYYPIKNWYNGEPLPFKNKKDYFRKKFSNRWQAIQWLIKNKDNPVAKEYAINELKNRIIEKGLQKAPNHIELEIYDLPPIDSYKMLFGSYTAACELSEVEPMFNKRMPQEFFNKSYNNIPIFIDSREQQPLLFDNSKTMKLDFGDYTSSGDYYSYTYVDRKGEQDFKSTLSTGFERFKKELDRCRNMGCYLYIVTESDIEQIKKRNNYSKHKSKLNYIWHNMRVLSHEYAGSCQFIFTGSRENSMKIIPKLLVLGDKMWNTDIQYYLDKKK